MFAFLICIIGIVITGGSLVVRGPYRNAIVFGVMGCLCLSYVYFLFVRKKNIYLNIAEKSLIAFILIGLFHVMISFMGMNQSLWNLDLYYDKSYIPRQAVYLFMLPAVILCQDKFYTKGKEYLISHYGEFIFWCLYFIHVYNAGWKILVSSQLILCWLALKIKSPQPWRNWARFAAVMLTPFAKDGVSTMLILRMIFAIVFLIPAGWKRTSLKWMTGIVLVVLIAASFIAPLVITDTSGISDSNTKWRLEYWGDAINNLKGTYGFGVGYGTSYPSITFAAIPERTARDFFSMERIFTLACHNSFVSLAMRTGILGIAAFLMFVFSMLREMLKYRVMPSRAAFFALFGAVACIAFNVGLESPNYMFSFIFCMAECNQEATRVRKESLLLHDMEMTPKEWSANMIGG